MARGERASIEAEADGVIRQLGGKWTGDFAMCRCPAHIDGKASLSVSASARFSSIASPAARPVRSWRRCVRARSLRPPVTIPVSARRGRGEQARACRVAARRTLRRYARRSLSAGGAVYYSRWHQRAVRSALPDRCGRGARVRPGVDRADRARSLASSPSTAPSSPPMVATRPPSMNPSGCSAIPVPARCAGAAFRSTASCASPKASRTPPAS